MEPHGTIPHQNVIAVIPARYSSVRLPGKMLLTVAGKPLVLHAADRAAEAALVSRVIVATDDERIFDAVKAAGVEAMMTSADHASGSDRVAEVAAGFEDDAIIVNVQGDEPLISPATIDSAVRELIADPSADMATTFEVIESVEELLNPNIVKIATGDDGTAVYFSRSPVPYPREAALRHGGDIVAAIRKEPGLISTFRKHTGLYVYRRRFLLEFTQMQPTALERTEMLEQLRALENGAKIKVVEAASRSIGVDTLHDLELVRAVLDSERRAHELVA